MSIAVLKRKTLNGNPRLAPISGSNNGRFGFSLNGTRRNIGVVGVTNLAPGAQSGPTQMIESTPSNITNPNGITGHPTSCCTNDIDVVKPSVINTRGMLSRRLKCLPPQPDWRTCTNCTSGSNPETGCYNWVQPIDNGVNKTHTQGQYTAKKGVQAIAAVGSGRAVGGGPSAEASSNPNCSVNDNALLNWPCVEGTPCYASNPLPALTEAESNQVGICQSPFIGSKKLFRGYYTKILPANGAQAAGAALSQGEYIMGRYLSKQCIPPDISNQHFPLDVDNSECATIYMTKAAAVAAGLYNNQ